MSLVSHRVPLPRLTLESPSEEIDEREWHPVPGPISQVGGASVAPPVADTVSPLPRTWCTSLATRLWDTPLAPALWPSNEQRHSQASTCSDKGSRNTPTRPGPPTKTTFRVFHLFFEIYVVPLQQQNTWVFPPKILPKGKWPNPVPTNSHQRR